MTTEDTRDEGPDAEARRQLVVDLFTTACEGGVNYWCDVFDYKWSGEDGEGYDYVGFRATLSDFVDGGAEYIVDRNTIIKGLQLAAKREILDKYSVYALEETALAYERGGRLLEDLDYDASTADAIVQLAIFGEITYG